MILSCKWPQLKNCFVSDLQSSSISCSFYIPFFRCRLFFSWCLLFALCCCEFLIKTSIQLFMCVLDLMCLAKKSFFICVVFCLTLYGYYVNGMYIVVGNYVQYWVDSFVTENVLLTDIIILIVDIKHLEQ